MFQPVWGDYQVLETDYENYSFVYSCSDFGGLYKSEFFWILTREAAPQNLLKITGHAETVFGSQVPDFDISSIRETSQGTDIGCNYEDVQM